MATTMTVNIASRQDSSDQPEAQPSSVRTYINRLPFIGTTGQWSAAGSENSPVKLARTFTIAFNANLQTWPRKSPAYAVLLLCPSEHNTLRLFRLRTTRSLVRQCTTSHHASV